MYSVLQYSDEDMMEHCCQDPLIQKGLQLLH